MAPIFDSGNSMFWDKPKIPLYSDLDDIEVNSFRPTEMKMLKLVTNKSLLDLNKLPTEDELRAIYEMDTLIPYVDSILMGYRKKIAMLESD